MSTQLYLDDSYIKEFQARVKRVDPENNAVILDQTAFYPAGGGQPSDLGILNFSGKTSKVIRVKKISSEIFHYLEDHLPEENDAVTGIIDWERRYKLMRTHTALHILSAVVWRDYNVQVTGGNMEPLSGRLDFEFEHLSAELISQIEDKVNLEISTERDVTSKIIPRTDANQIPDLIRTKINLLPPELDPIRVVEILGLDLQADGGTHVKNTREIGKLKIVKYKSKGRMNKRIQIEVV